MSELEVLEKVKQYVSVAYHVEKETLTPETELLSISTRSILTAAFVSLISEDLRVSLTIGEVTKAGNIQNIANLISSKL